MTQPDRQALDAALLLLPLRFVSLLTWRCTHAHTDIRRASRREKGPCNHEINIKALMTAISMHDTSRMSAIPPKNNVQGLPSSSEVDTGSSRESIRQPTWQQYVRMDNCQAKVSKLAAACCLPWDALVLQPQFSPLLPDSAHSIAFAHLNFAASASLQGIVAEHSFKYDALHVKDACVGESQHAVFLHSRWAIISISLPQRQTCSYIPLWRTEGG